jgi:hypothetical protein
MLPGRMVNQDYQNIKSLSKKFHIHRVVDTYKLNVYGNLTWQSGWNATWEQNKHATANSHEIQCFFLFCVVVVVIFHFYIQYRHCNSFTQQDITHTILAFSYLDIYIYFLNIRRTSPNSNSSRDEQKQYISWNCS